MCYSCAVSEPLTVDKKTKAGELSVEKIGSRRCGDLVIRTRHQRHVEQFGEQGMYRNIHTERERERAIIEQTVL